jgi:RimJ/RimL family protein N-acetyltransferase
MPQVSSADRRIMTARTVLTPLVVDDATELAEVLADPALHTFTGGEPLDVEALRARYTVLVRGSSADGLETWLNWVIRARDGDQAVGYLQATVTGGGTLAEVAWVVGTPWQGRGYAAEGAATLVGWLAAAGARTVVAHIHPEHAASEAVARRAGLTPTGETDADGEQRWELRTT